MRTPVAIAVAAALLLAACGGGGGSPPTTGVAPPPQTPDSTSSPTVGQVNQFRQQVAVAVSRVVFDDTRPYFGSAAVATAPRVTDVETTFDGQRVTVTIGRAGRDVLLDTGGTWLDVGETASSLGLPDRRSRTRLIHVTDGANGTLGLVTVDWTDGDPADYLAGGYWLRYEPNSRQSVQVGAFVDGPELDLSSPPTLPVTGYASYLGTGGGLYATEYGNDFLLPPGSTETGEFIGNASLTVSFDDNTVEGCVGCGGGLRVVGIGRNSATGQVEEFDTQTFYAVEFGQVPLNRANGTFQGTDVRLTHSLEGDFPTTGTWAGQFSNQPNVNGEPRAAGGAFVLAATTRGGSRAVLTGAFAVGNP